jgi:hypothetical protein
MSGLEILNQRHQRSKETVVTQFELSTTKETAKLLLWLQSSDQCYWKTTSKTRKEAETAIWNAVVWFFHLLPQTY